jgi:predicted transcriptional regulator
MGRCPSCGRGPVPREQAQPFVFSIRPQYVERILDGHKRWEYRRRRPRVEHGDLILIYETAPMSKIVASARVGAVRCGHMLEIWAETDRDGCVSPEEYAAYFDGVSQAVAIELTHVQVFADPLPLPGGMVAPQSWSRLRAGAIEWWDITHDVSGLVLS